MSNDEIVLTVYFDGLCHLCSREIEHYRSMRGAERICFVDITSEGFDASAEGLDPYEIHKHLHARDSMDQLHVGIDTFIQIWSHLPALRLLALLASRKPIYKSLNVLYEIFAHIRPYLPRKSCSSSPYCETSRRP